MPNRYKVDCDWALWVNAHNNEPAVWFGLCYLIFFFYRIAKQVGFWDYLKGNEAEQFTTMLFNTMSGEKHWKVTCAHARTNYISVKCQEPCTGDEQKCCHLIVNHIIDFMVSWGICGKKTPFLKCTFSIWSINSKYFTLSVFHLFLILTQKQHSLLLCNGRFFSVSNGTAMPDDINYCTKAWKAAPETYTRVNEAKRQC